MRVGDWFTVFLKLATDHPLIAFWLCLILLLMLLLGGLHVCRVLGRCLIVVIREVKHELSGLLDVFRDLAKEFVRWKSDP